MKGNLLISFKRALQSLATHWITSVPTICVLALVLSLFHAIMVVKSEASQAIALLENKVTFTVYLKQDADPFDVGNLVTYLESRKDLVQSVQYTSKEDALRILNAQFSLQNEVLDKYGFSLPPSLTVRPVKPEVTDEIQSLIRTRGSNLLHETLNSTDKQKNAQKNLTGFLATLEETTVKTLVILLIIFSISALLLIASALHLAISNRHKEITIMKLVGASYASITTPLVLEGIFIGLGAFIVNIFFIALMPFRGGSQQLIFNSLLLEGVGAILISAGVSYLVGRIFIKRNSF